VRIAHSRHSEVGHVAEQRGHDFVQSLERGLAVIRAFDGENPRLTLSDVSRRTGLTRAASRRFLLTLVELGYVHHDGREFSLRPSVLDLGFAYLSSMGLPEVAMPHMETLVAMLQESSSMSVLDGENIVYVARVPTRRRIMTVSIAVGTRFPAFATSMGRVLLAGLTPDDLDAALAGLDLHSYTETTVHDAGELRAAIEVARDRGYAIVDQELEHGLRSVAAPVRDDAGTTIAAVNVSVHASRATIDDIEKKFVPPLLDAVARIGADFSSLGPRPNDRE
jgi:IclR family transcriptional regulator, pca regulon regulatory protein